MVQLAAWLASNLFAFISSHDRVLVNVGSSRGATQLTENLHQQFLSTGSVPAFTSPLTTQANVSSIIASLLQNNQALPIDHSLTCSTGLAAIANAEAWLRAGMADAVVVGASEASVTPFTLAQVNALGIGSDISSGNFPCRPFNADQSNTFVLAEGAGLAVMRFDEPEPGDLHVVASGYAHQSPHSPTGIADDGGPLISSMKMALAKLPSHACIGLVLAHAPGTVKGDAAEINAISSVLGDEMPVYSTKWLTGHTYAASAMLNLQAAKEIFAGAPCLPYPYQTYIPFPVFEKPEYILINATGFGGNAMSLVVTG